MKIRIPKLIFLVEFQLFFRPCQQSMEEKSRMLDILLGELEKHGVALSLRPGKWQSRLEADSERISCQMTGVAGPDLLEKAIQLGKLFC